MRNTAFFIPLFLAFWLVACSSNPPAPVIDRLPSSQANTQKESVGSKPTNKAGDWRPDTYTVKKGDTLYSIGLEHGYYYKEIALANSIVAPYTIHVGQTLKFTALKEKPLAAETKPIQSTGDEVVISPVDAGGTSTSVTNNIPEQTPPKVLAISEPKALREPYSEEALKKPLPQPKLLIEKPTTAIVNKPAVVISTNAGSKPATENKPQVKAEPKSSADNAEDINWAWPTKGKVIANFNDAGNKGIDIAGTSGQAITAAAAGKVIYSGSDLRGYGKLVIIKHNANYLSVYAHNSLILAKEGQQISSGQKIAEMGNTDSNAVKLHFEIRRQGKSVDPSKYLPPN